MSELSNLEARLEKLVEADGEPAEIAGLISQIEDLRANGATSPAGADRDSAETLQPKEGNEMDEQRTINLGLPAQEAETPGIRSVELGFTPGQERSLPGISLSTIQGAIAKVGDEGYSDLAAIYIEGVTDPGKRVHVGNNGDLSRGDITRMARGLGLYLAGGLQDDGTILSPNGNVHRIENGVCWEIVEKPAVNSDGSPAVVRRTVACEGHKQTRNVGSSDAPKFKETGKEHDYCYHQYAALIGAGYCFTFSIEYHMKRVISNAASRFGDEAAREYAQGIFDEWRENSQNRFEERKAHAVARAAKVNELGLEDDELLPDVPEFLELPVNGMTVRDAVIALQGRQFTVVVEYPISPERSIQRNLNARTLAELQSRAAMPMAVADQNGGRVKVLEVNAR